MIQAAYYDMRYPGEAFYGTALSGAGAVENLQRSLKALAQTSGWTSVNPAGYVAGVVGDQTLMAVVAAVQRGILNHISDSTARMAIQTGLLIGMGSETARAYARTLISSYATQLDVAVRTLAMRVAGQSGPPATNATTQRDTSLQQLKTSSAVQSATTPWYKNMKVIVPVAVGTGALGIAALFLLR
jgi:lysozyme family protein